MAYSGKWWYLELVTYLISKEGGFNQTESEQALFVKKESDGSITKILVYSDDCLYFNSKKNEEKLIAFEKQISARFDVEFKGLAHWFLSMRIARDKFGNYTLDQSRYTLSVVDKYLGAVSNRKKVNRPLASGWEPSKKHCSQSDAEVDALSSEYRLDYPAVIGSLIYLMNTRPDIIFAVTKLAKFMRYPGRDHFVAVIHLLQYLKNNSHYGLKYYRNPDDSPVYDALKQVGVDPIHTLFGMHDSSWQDCPDTGRSTGCYLLFDQGGVVDFSTFVPSPIAMSSAEAEMNAGACAYMAMSYLRMLNNDLNNEDTDLLWTPPIMMLCDNKSAVTIVNSDKDFKSQRHCKRRLMYMRQVRKEKEMLSAFLKNDYMFADIGTKNLDVPNMQPITNTIMVEVPL